MIKCPYCDSTEVFYCQTVKEYHGVGEIEEDGNLELVGVDDSIVDESFPFIFLCTCCDKEHEYEKFVKDYLKLKGSRVDG